MNVAIEEAVRKAMAEELQEPRQRVGPGYTRASSETWDSLAHLRLISAIEEEFGLRFAMEEIGELDSFERICAAVAGRSR
jgi:acyl carrier protein